MAVPAHVSVASSSSRLPIWTAWAWALWLVAAVLWALSTQLDSTTHALTLSSISVTIVAWGAALVMAGPTQGRGSWLRLGPLMLIYGGVTFGLTTATAWLAPETLNVNVQLETFRHAHALVIFGFLAFAGGYLIKRRAGLHRLIAGGMRRVDGWCAGRHVFASSALFTYVFGLSALVMGAMQSGNYGYLGDSMITTTGDVAWYTQPLVIVGSLRGFAILTLWVDAWRGVRSRMALALAVTMFDLVVGLFSGMKEAPLVTVLAVGLAYVHAKRRLPILGALGVGAGFVFILSPVVEAIRATVRGRSTLTLHEALTVVPSVLAQGGQGAQENIWAAVARLRLIDNVAVITQKSPSEIPFEPTRDLVLSSLAGLIPRAVWPTKPLRLEGLTFYKQYYGGSTYSSSAVTIPGSLYMYGGIIVLITGMMLFGMLVRSLDDGMRADESVTGLMMMLALFPSFIKMEASMPTLLASLPIEVAGWLMATWLLFRSVGSARSRAPVDRRSSTPDSLGMLRPGRQ